MSRSEALKFLKKKMPGALVADSGVSQVIEGISSGCVAVDYILGNGGFPRGKICEVYGPESSGKTTLCLSTCAMAQALGLYPVYVDIERGLDATFAAKIGFDWQDEDKALYIKPDTFEEVLIIIDKMSTDGKADIIVVDSVPALVPEAQMKGKIEEIGMLGSVGRLFAASLPRLVKTIERTRTAVIFTNQLRANIVTDPWAARFAPKEKTAGGFALKYFASIRLELRQVKKNAKVVMKPSLTDPADDKKMEEIPVASRHSAHAFKNKVSIPYRSIEFFIRYDPDNDIWGVDDLQTILDIALGKNIIETKGGGYFVYTPDMRVQGEQAMYDWFAQRTDEVSKLRVKLGV